MNWFFSIMFIVTMYPILLAMYFFLKGAGNVEKKYCFGVTLPYEIRGYEQIKAIIGTYNKNLTISTVIFAIMPIAICGVPYFSIQITIYIIWILLVCFYGMFFYAKANKKVRLLKNQLGFSEAEDDKHWHWGMIYCNKNDKHILVESRMGMGTTTNIGTKVGLAMEMFGLLVILLLPLFCVWMIYLEFTTV